MENDGRRDPVSVTNCKHATFFPKAGRTLVVGNVNKLVASCYLFADTVFLVFICLFELYVQQFDPQPFCHWKRKFGDPKEREVIWKGLIPTRRSSLEGEKKRKS